MYAQKYYLRNKVKRTLTDTVSSFEEYLPKYMVLPHPSPRNRFWLTKNPWFSESVLPVLRNKVAGIIL
jgi:uracil-DNA glycosylase